MFLISTHQSLKWLSGLLGLLALGLFLAIPTAAIAQESIAIDVWYGDEQTVADGCLTQQKINILGRVTADNDITRLTYRLNGGAPQEIEVGPNLFRLADPGDFNVDLPITALRSGKNQVELLAEDSAGETTIRTVIVQRLKQTRQLPPANETIDWQTVDLGLNSPGVIDGRWEITPDGLRSIEPGYDRLVGLCPQSWQNFELTVPITVHAIDPRKEWPSNGSGVGLAFHWNGHEDWNDIQPDYGWYPIGGFNLLSWDYAGGRTEPREAILLNGNEYWPLDEQLSALEIGRTYMFKLRSEHVPGYGSLYKSKVWLADENEPSAWLLQGRQYDWHPFYGSILLVSHHADATFGPVTITNLDNGMLNRILNLLPFLGLLPLLLLGLVALFHGFKTSNGLPSSWRASLKWAGAATVIFAAGKPLADFAIPRIMHDLSYNFEFISVVLTLANIVLAAIMFIGLTQFIIKVSRGKVSQAG